MTKSAFSELNADQLCRGMDQVHGLLNAVEWQLFSLIVVYDDNKHYELDGACSMAEWLSMRFGVSCTTARLWVTVAHALKELPATAEAFSEGRLSLDQVKLLVDIGTPESERELCERAQGMTIAALQQLARDTKRVTAAQDEEAHRRRAVHWKWDEKACCLRLWGRLRADQGAIVVKSLERGGGPNAAARERPLRGHGHACRGRADRAVRAGARRVGRPGPGDGRGPCRRLAASREGSAWIEDGISLSQEAAQRLTCDGRRIQLVAHSEDGAVVGVGRASRRVPAWLLRQVKARDGGCVFPGCRRRRFTEAHHIRHWAKGGNTDLGNLRLLCRRHHRLVHEQGWEIRNGSDDAVVFIRPDGLPLNPRPDPFKWGLLPPVANRPEPVDTS